MFVVACQTTPKTETKELQFFTGKAQVFDKKKKKEEWVYFNSAVRPSENKLRLDVSMGILGIPIGLLVINGNKATLISLYEKKAYVTENGDQLLEKLLKTPISPQHITALFGEAFPLGGGWDCNGSEAIKCVKSDLQVDWQRNPDQDRKMVIDSPRSRVTFVYQPAHSGKDSFEVAIPKGFEVIKL